MGDLFKKYMKLKDPQTAHAVLSASGSERWLHCPGSVKLSEGIPQIDNEYSIAGTHAHTLLQFILENYQKHAQLLRSPAAKTFKKFISYSEEQYESVMLAVRYVKAEEVRMHSRTKVWPQLFIEQKLELKNVGFGTSDIILYQPFGLLHVMDYKNGASPVEPRENTQGLYYAVAAADAHGWNFNQVWITIIQPNAAHKEGPIRTWRTNPERLEEAAHMFKRGALATKKKNAPLVVDSKWCWFCTARTICPKQMTLKQTKIMERFER